MEFPSILGEYPLFHETDPDNRDPDQNEMDPLHWYFLWRKKSIKKVEIVSDPVSLFHGSGYTVPDVDPDQN